METDQAVSYIGWQEITDTLFAPMHQVWLILCVCGGITESCQIKSQEYGWPHTKVLISHTFSQQNNNTKVKQNMKRMSFSILSEQQGGDSEHKLTCPSAVCRLGKSTYVGDDDLGMRSIVLKTKKCKDETGVLLFSKWS